MTLARSWPRRIATWAVGAGMALGAAALTPLGLRALAQRPAAPAPPPRSADSLVVSVLTIGPGEQLFDRFGHASIRVRNVATGLDSAWNWGMYDFESAGFIWRFLTGDTRYWMAGYPTDLVVGFYARAQRAIWEQELALDAAQADSLLRLLRWNARDENKFYRYDYYLDNCATRVRDALDAVLGGSLRTALAVPGAGVTWRGETLRLSAAFPAIAFGMTFALGRPADDTLTRWDEGFIPMRFRDAMRDVRIGSAEPRPLVRAERVLAPEGAFPEEPSPPTYAAVALAIGTLIAIGVAWLARLARAGGRQARAARVAVGTIGSLWHLTIGFAGTLVLLAGLFTRHEFMAHNGSVLLGTPASLALGVLYAMAWRTGASNRVVAAARALGTVTLATGTVGLILAFAPVGAMHGAWAAAALAVPAHLGCALALDPEWAARWWGRARA